MLKHFVLFALFTAALTTPYLHPAQASGFSCDKSDVRAFTVCLKEHFPIGSAFDALKKVLTQNGFNLAPQGGEGLFLFKSNGAHSINVTGIHDKNGLIVKVKGVASP